MPVEDYVRNAVVTNVVDGDTIDISMDLGCCIWHNLRVRVLGVNTPETKGSTKEAGLRSKQATKDWLSRSTDGRVVVRTHKDPLDSFGRLLAEIWIGEESLSAYLLTNGFAVPFTK